MPPDLQSNILTTFKTKKTHGLGFGLSHSKTIIQAQGGDITFTTVIGESTTFKVRLPDIPG